ncbi:MAG: hypothetical protein JW953_04065 [Anaerolineae bacterium]|nr:hypothetical protein [Anaerolineae bacterium]
MVTEAKSVTGVARVGRREWLWVLAWSVVIMFITSLPYLYGAMLSTPANQFGGFVIGVEDGNAYLAKMRLGASGSWRFHLFYTAEPHEGVYLFLFHLVLGKPARLSGLSFDLVYHLARIVFGFILLLTIYYFTAFFTGERPVRRLVFWLAALGSGLGWLVALLGWLDWLGLPLDFYLPEAFTFHLLFALPHLALAQTLLLWAILLALVSWEKQRARYALLAGLALLGVGLIAAFYVLIGLAAVGSGWLLRQWRETMAPKTSERPMYQAAWSEIKLMALMFTLPAPVLLYNAYVFTANPVFKTWRIENLFLSPAPVHYLLAIGLLIPLAAVGGWQEWQRGASRSLLLLGWGVIALLLLYFPFGFQRRLMFGLQIPLSVLAALGLWYLLQARSKTDGGTGRGSRVWRVTSVGLVALLSLSNLMILFGSFGEVSRQAPPLFHAEAQINAADWLGRQAAPNDVILAAYETGNYLPSRMPARVFAGHVTETIHSKAKRAKLPQFFARNNDEFRRQLLQDYQITYLFYGPAEQALGDFSPEGMSYLQPVYNNGVVQIYRVNLDHE